MRIENTVEVDAPLDRVWALVNDIPRVAPCMPGAALTGVVDDTTYEGLRLVEWLRGLCALSALAELDYTDNVLKNDPIILPDQHYRDLLVRVGLTLAQAATYQALCR